jgi:hypothetical protein
MKRLVLLALGVAAGMSLVLLAVLLVSEKDVQTTKGMASRTQGGAVRVVSENQYVVAKWARDEYFEEPYRIDREIHLQPVYGDVANSVSQTSPHCFFKHRKSNA